MGQNKVLFFSVFIGLLLLGAFLFSPGPGGKKQKKEAKKSDTAVQTAAEECLSDSQCGRDNFCRQGRCENFSPNTFCRFDSDCKLINLNYKFRCCFTGVCDAVDYSKSEWIAVNKEWFENQRADFCPDREACGKMPVCAGKIINDDFKARCAVDVCEKRQGLGF